MRKTGIFSDVTYSLAKQMLSGEYYRSLVNPTDMIADGVSIATVTATIYDANSNIVAASTGPVTFMITGGLVWDSDGTQVDKGVIAASLYESPR